MKQPRPSGYGEQIKRLMAAPDVQLTVEACADALDVTPNAVQQWRAGLFRPGSKERRRELAKLLKVTPEEFDLVLAEKLTARACLARRGILDTASTVSTPKHRTSRPLFRPRGPRRLFRRSARLRSRTLTSGIVPSGLHGTMVRLPAGNNVPIMVHGSSDHATAGHQLQRTAPAVPTVIAVPWYAQHTVDLAALLTMNHLMLDRRAAFQNLATATVATGAALLEPLEAWLRPPAKQPGRLALGRLGLRQVEQLEQMAQVFRTWNHAYGGDLRGKAVAGLLNEVAAALKDRQAPAVEVRLYRVMARLAKTIASMAWDSGLQRRAQDYYLLALRAAHAGGDRPFGANVLSAMARQMLYQGQPQDALELVRLAQHGLRDSAGPRVDAMLYTREAWALAAMGRVAAFWRTTARAHEALAAAGPHEDHDWIAYFDEAELVGVTGGRLLDLARIDPAGYADRASEEIDKALASRGIEAGRGHALDRIGLAECRFLLGDSAEAAAQTHQAVDVAEHIPSGRVRTRLAELYPYTIKHAHHAGVRDARDRIRTMLELEGSP